LLIRNFIIDHVSPLLLAFKIIFSRLNYCQADGALADGNRAFNLLPLQYALNDAFRKAVHSNCHSNSNGDQIVTFISMKE
jgi:hypothetical protein